MPLQKSDRYKQSALKQTPKLGTKEVKDRVEKYPLSKNELVDYLIKLQSSKQMVDKHTYKKLMSQPKFKEILDEVQIQRKKKRECKRIMEMC